MFSESTMSNFPRVIAVLVIFVKLAINNQRESRHNKNGTYS